MDRDVVDVKYEDVPAETTDTPKNVKINVDPVSTLISESISGICGIVNNITNSVKEYNICKQQEETKRAEIRAYLKIGLAQIEAQKEIYIKQLEQHHEAQMEYIRTINEMAMKQLDASLDALQAATETAKETKDYSTVIEMMNITNSFVDLRSKATLALMDKTTAPQNLSIGVSSPAGFISSQ